MKYTTQQPLKRKWTGPTEKSREFLWLKWVNIWASTRENLSSGFANKGPDQPAHQRSLISAFVILFYVNLKQVKLQFSC